ncbi:MAG: hypothetical protein IKX22_05630 [Prevotella sp.]|nr:hypothetical protein [Prevotella sp.]
MERYVKIAVWLIPVVVIVVLFLLLADMSTNVCARIGLVFVLLSYGLIVLGSYSDKERAGVMNLTTVMVAVINFVLELVVAIVFSCFMPEKTTTAFVVHFILLMPTLLVMGLSYLANKNTRKKLGDE